LDIVKADVGSKDGNGKAGNPDIQPGVTVHRLSTEVIADKEKSSAPVASRLEAAHQALHRVNFSEIHDSALTRCPAEG